MTMPPVTGPRRAAMVFIFVTVVLDMLAIGMIIPVLPKLVEGLTGGDTARAAGIYGVFGTVWATMQFLFSPVLGAMSDRFGRRPVVLFSNFGLGLDYVLMALAPTISWLFVGRIISGITAASVSTASAYIADVTPPEKRAASFGMLGAAFGLGFILGPALGGILGDMDPRLPFWVAAGLSLLNATYGLFVLPESLPKERRVAFDWKKANPLGSLSLLRSHAQLRGLSGVIFLNNLAHVVFPSVFVLYAGHRYHWEPKEVGLALSVVGICSMIVQGGLVRPIVTKFGERSTLFFGLLCGVVGFAIMGTAPTGMLFMASIPFSSLWGLSGPATQGLMTQIVGATEQGRLQGANSSLMGFANMIGPSIFTLSFAFAIGAGRESFDVPGIPFYLSSLMLAIAAVVAWPAAAAAKSP